jgi:uncharacterized protein
MRPSLRFALLAAAGLLLSGFELTSSEDSGAPPEIVSQPTDERAAQELLPISQDPIWSVLAKTKILIDEEQGLYDAEFPQAVKDLDGKQVSVTGFMLPLEASDTFHHFLLSKRTPTCPFCPPGEPNEIVDVWTDQPAEWDDGAVTVTGNFTLMRDREMGLFFKLSEATIK